MSFSFIRRVFAAGVFCLLCSSTRAQAQVTELKVAPWWYLQEQIEHFFAGATEQDPGSGPSSTEGDPPSPATETETEWIVKLCNIQNPLDQDKKICITIRINKKTGDVRITVPGIFILPLTYKIKCAKDGKCVIIDDLPPITTFCQITRDEGGTVHYVCRFTYFGIKVDKTIKLYIEDGNLCIQVGDSTPDCRPFENLPDWVKKIWRSVQPLWLPIPPPEPMGPPAPDELDRIGDGGARDPLVNNMGSDAIGG